MQYNMFHCLHGMWHPCS